MTTTEYWAYSSKDDWEAAVAALTRAGNSAFVAMVAKPAKATLSVSME